MHIDTHQHFWIYDRREYGWIDDSMAALRRDFLPDDLKPELDRENFQGSIAVQARQTLEETRWLLELAEFPNVFCKLSGLVTEADWLHWKPEQINPYLDVAFDSFGPDRLMIGSD